MKSKSFLDEPMIVSTGDSKKAIKNAKNILTEHEKKISNSKFQ